jgi:hypothetical protein
MDEAPTADQGAVMLETLQALDEELQRNFGLVLPMAATGEIEDDVFLPLANLLASEAAADFGVPAPMSRATALIRLRAVTNPDDRTGPVKAEYY